MEYKLPSLDANGANAGKTKGGQALASVDNKGVKTIYDSVIWTDTKLEQALKEALTDYKIKNTNIPNDGFNSFTKEGIKLRIYIKNNKVDTFYFTK